MTDVRDQDNTRISEGDILLNEQGKCYRVVETGRSILAQGVVSAVLIERTERASVYVRAYHCFVIPESVRRDDGKVLHHRLLNRGADDRRSNMKARRFMTDRVLRRPRLGRAEQRLKREELTR